MGKIKKIGLFGGTFNPIHLGHLIISEIFTDELILDEMIFIPASKSPFKKDTTEVLDSTERFKLIELAIEGNPKFNISDYEINKGGISYTFQTIEYFRSKYPEDEIYWLIGGDQIINFHKWKNFRFILDNIHLTVASRPDTFLSEEKLQIEQNLSPKYKINWLNSPNIEISSTDIRNKIRQNKSIKYLVMPDCENYILQNNLYAD